MDQACCKKEQKKFQSGNNRSTGSFRLREILPDWNIYIREVLDTCGAKGIKN